MTDPRPGRRVQIFSDGPSLTQQQFKDEVDVNIILKKWRRTGDLTHVNQGSGNYGDFSNADTYLAAKNAVMDAQRDFDELPSDLRARFHNSPQELLEFVSIEGNEKEAIEIGLIPGPDALPAPPSDPPAAARPPEASPSPQPTPIAGGE